MDIRQQFNGLRDNVDKLRAFILSEEFSAQPQQARLLFNEQLAAMERQSVAMSELINLSDGLQSTSESSERVNRQSLVPSTN